MLASTTRGTRRHIRVRLALAVTSAAVGVAAAACAGYATDASPDAGARADLAAVAAAGAPPGARVQYGTPVQIGEGRARAYVEYDALTGNTPTEIGVAPFARVSAT